MFCFVLFSSISYNQIKFCDFNYFCHLATCFYSKCVIRGNYPLEQFNAIQYTLLTATVISISSFFPHSLFPPCFFSFLFFILLCSNFILSLFCTISCCISSNKWPTSLIFLISIQDGAAYEELIFNPAADEEPLWEMQQRQRREQAVLLEQQLDRQRRRAAGDELRRGRAAVQSMDMVDMARMGTRTRERNQSARAVSPIPPSR